MCDSIIYGGDLHIYISINFLEYSLFYFIWGLNTSTHHLQGKFHSVRGGVSARQPVPAADRRLLNPFESRGNGNKQRFLTERAGKMLARS